VLLLFACPSTARKPEPFQGTPAQPRAVIAKYGGKGCREQPFSSDRHMRLTTAIWSPSVSNGDLVTVVLEIGNVGDQIDRPASRWVDPGHPQAAVAAT
jgi:hypothetical protein